MISGHPQSSASPADDLGRLQLLDLDHDGKSRLKDDFDAISQNPGITVEAPRVFAEWEPFGPGGQIGEGAPTGVGGGLYVDRMMHDHWPRTLPHPTAHDYTSQLD